MLNTFFFICLFAVLFVVLGSYRMRVRLVVFRQTADVSVRLASRWGLYGVGWCRGAKGARWHGSVLGRDFPLRRKEGERGPAGLEERTTAGGKRRRSRRRTPLLCMAGRVLPRVPEMALGLLRPFRIHEFRLRGELGLGDPALTGQMYGLIQGVVFACCGRTSVSIRPRFDTSVMEGEFTLVTGFILIHTVWTAIRTAASMGWAYMRCRR